MGVKGFESPQLHPDLKGWKLLLADRGEHRAPSTLNLLIGATAELAGLTVLHVDKDFELIAATTGQPVERLVLA